MPKPTEFALWAPIAKVDEDQRMVWGWASTERKDLQGEIIKSDAIREALPDYMTWSNIREMHRPSAVGIAKEAEMRSLPDGDGEGLWLGAKIVDDAAWQKVTEEVYKGFSVGGERLHKSGNVIDEVRIVEISLVDRPANPDCRIEVVKVAGAVEHPAKEESEDVQEALADSADDFGRLEKLLSKFHRVARMLGVEKADTVSGATNLEKKELSSKERDDLPDSKFGYVDENGEGHFPIHDANHVRNALARMNQSPYGPKAKAKILAAAKKFGIKVGDDKAEKMAGADGIEKMTEVADLASVYETLQYLKRRLRNEAMFENDPDDGEHAKKVQAIAAMIADLMETRIKHEVDEDADDEEDAAHAMVEQGAITMAAEATDLQKRFSKAHAASMTKAADHLGKACKVAGQMGQHMGAMEKCFGMSKKDDGDADDKVDMKGLKEVLGKLKDAHEQMSDHLDVASSHIDKVMKGINVDETGGHEEKEDPKEAGADATDLKKKAASADVEPEGDADDAAVLIALAGKPKAFKKYLETMRERDSQAAVQSATLTKAANTPKGQPLVRTFAINKGAADVAAAAESAESADIFAGVDKNDPNAAAKVFGKMIASGQHGRPVLGDPTFHGGAGK